MEEKNFLTERLKYSTEYGVNLDTRTIYIFNDLTEEIGFVLRQRYNIIKQWWDHVEKKQYNDININISSFGGSIYAIGSVLDFYDELLKDNILVNTNAHTVCMSAATILLAGGTGKRTCNKRTTFMLHDVQCGGIEGSVKQIQDTMENLNEEQLILFTYYATYANKDKTFTDKTLKVEAEKWIKKYAKNNKEHYLKAKDMLDLKLIDEII